MIKVNQPNHYNATRIETIEIIEVVTTGYDGHTAFLVGNVIKYLARACYKGEFQTDLMKAQNYMNKIIDYIGGATYGNETNEDQILLFTENKEV